MMALSKPGLWDITNDPPRGINRVRRSCQQDGSLADHTDDDPRETEVEHRAVRNTPVGNHCFCTGGQGSRQAPVGFGPRGRQGIESYER